MSRIEKHINSDRDVEARSRSKNATNMEKATLLAYKGRLVCVQQAGTSIELDSFIFSRRTGFCAELVSKSTLSAKLRWEIEDVRNIVDDRSGIEAPLILVSHDGYSDARKRFCVIQSIWNGSILTCHKSTDGEHGSAGKATVHLAPLMEFTCSTSPSKTPVCSLLYGPMVLVTNRNRLSLFTINSSNYSRSKNMVYKKDFCICDTNVDNAKQTADQKTTDDSLSGVDSHGDSESTILYAILEEKWIVAVLLMKLKGLDLEENHCSSLITVEIERRSENNEFRRRSLRTSDFLPEEYASKVSSLIIRHCQRMSCPESGMSVYKNECAVGLNDGFVVMLADGIIQQCITLWTHIGADYPAFGVTKLLEFGYDILVCLTDTRHCFIVDETEQVKHHWEDVANALVGDFLQQGGQQLLLLFSSLPQGPPTSYLLTDLQGFVVDCRRPNSGGDAAASLSGLEDDEEHDLFLDEEEKTSDRNQLQPVVDALLEQNQALARRVAEEEQKLACKQQFVGETWRRLLNLGLQGEEGVTTSLLSPPEVPLATLLGGGHPDSNPLDIGTQHRASPPEPEGDVEVQSLWNHLLDSSCVIGVRILNVSGRELLNCVLALTPSVASQSTCISGELSARTAVWQCFCTDPSHTHPAPAELRSCGGTTTAAPRKRQKVSRRRVCVRRTETVQPLESVVVTCVLDVPELGWCGELAYHVDLIYAVKERRNSAGCSGQGLSASTSTAPDAAVRRDSENGERWCDERGDRGSGSLEVGGGRTKSTSCGEVVLKASELLQGKHIFERLMEEQKDDPQEESDPAQLEEEVLALHSIQQHWLCHIDVPRHDGSVIPRCLRSAGFVFSGHLGQHCMSEAGAPRCLQFVRAEVLGFAAYPRRVARVLVFARDSNQLLLLLRHLYTHLPSNATITTQTSRDPNSDHLQQLTQLLTTQLCERRRLARTLLQKENPAPSLAPSGPGVECAISKSQPPAPGPSSVMSEKSQTTPAEKGNVHGRSQSSELESSQSEGAAKSQSEEFAEWQRTLRQMQTRLVGRENVGRFKAALLESETDTHMAFAKLKV